MNTTDGAIIVENTFRFSTEYKNFFTDLKNRIRTSRSQAALAINCEVIKLYWHIGNQILQRQQTTSWGTKLIETLSLDLQNTFPETHGFSPVNLKRMRKFAQTYPDIEIGVIL